MIRSALACVLMCTAGSASAEHATWLHGQWWRSKGRRAKAVRILARGLDERGIRWIFPRAGFLRRSGRTPRAVGSARALVRRLKRLIPAAMVLPWVIGFTHRHLSPGRRWIRRTAQGLARLVARSGADGVHLDVEPPFGSFGQIPGDRLARLAKNLRRLRPAGLISFAVHPLATPTFPRGLRPDNIRPLLDAADQIVVMMYDTALDDPDRFARAVAEQVEMLGRMAKGRRARLWLGAAAYPAHRARRWRRLHRPNIENVATTTRALAAAMAGSRFADRWRGVAVFAHYSARRRDWIDLRTGWAAAFRPMGRGESAAPRPNGGTKETRDE